MKSIVFFSRTGCFLPFLIFFNFLFGWIFLGFFYWLAAELILVTLFILNSVLLAKKFVSSSGYGAAGSKSKDIIDIEAEVVHDKDKLK
ncbi:MAG: hypothetical protein C4533_04820 [Candidatus Omnitrophota bacterium]|jgi:ABC-type protease/lipase transport system fused ATPase/permease subunit|nr:MAG: hypothetical protein C4533_04820 [Candidatus Omnitrophota bacterium]